MFSNELDTWIRLEGVLVSVKLSSLGSSLCERGESRFKFGGWGTRRYLRVGAKFVGSVAWYCARVLRWLAGQGLMSLRWVSATGIQEYSISKGELMGVQQGAFWNALAASHLLRQKAVWEKRKEGALTKKRIWRRYTVHPWILSSGVKPTPFPG
jgi:hypothetical protein